MSTSSRTVQPDVRVGQVWADNDPRSAGRTIEIIETGITKERITKERITEVAPWLQLRGLERRRQEPAVRVRVLSVARNVGTQQIGRETTILLSRFRPNSSGYRLIQDVEVAR